MNTNMNKSRRLLQSLLHRLHDVLPKFLLGLVVLSLLAAGYQGTKLWQARQSNAAYDSRQLAKHKLNVGEYAQAYSIGYLLLSMNKKEQALNAFKFAEATDDPDLYVRTKFALGNLYGDVGLHNADIAAGGSHQLAVSQILLAREAYKNALRIQPDLYAARYNLELLDRRSPGKRTQGWEIKPDSDVKLKPFKSNGTALMKDNTIRGLP
jgi:tetratricopeptide (TPR) repeat protein